MQKQRDKSNNWICTTENKMATQIPKEATPAFIYTIAKEHV